MFTHPEKIFHFSKLFKLLSPYVTAKFIEYLKSGFVSFANTIFSFLSDCLDKVDRKTSFAIYKTKNPSYCYQVFPADFLHEMHFYS